MLVLLVLQESITETMRNNKFIRYFKHIHDKILIELSYSMSH